MIRIRREIWLIVPLLLWMAIDVSLTLVGQSREYWLGDYSAAQEANPFAYPFLAYDPGLFAGLAVVWGAVIAGVVYNVRRNWTRWLAVIVSISHLVGGCTWLARHQGLGYALMCGYLLVSAEVSFRCWRHYIRADKIRLNTS